MNDNEGKIKYIAVTYLKWHKKIQNIFFSEPPTSFAILQNKVAVGPDGNITVVDGQVNIHTYSDIFIYMIIRS